MTFTPHEAPSLIDEPEVQASQALAHEVSIVIPAFNEADHINDLIGELLGVMERTGWRFEIIVVDDGSSDETAQRAAFEGVRVLRHRINRGYGAALKRGIAAAQYGWILITDADGTYPSTAIPDLLSAASENDMVVGARTGETVKDPLLRRPAKWMLRRLASYLVGRPIPDLNSGFRLIRKDLVARYEHLLPSGFSFTTTITLAAACNDHEVLYIPIDYHARLGTSKIRPWHAFDFTLLILRTIVFFNPLKVFIPAGTVLVVVGLAKFAYDVTQQNISDSAVLMLLSALIIWAIGLLADQNSHLLKHR